MIKKFKLWVWSRLGSNTKVTSLFSSYINLPLILLIGFHIYFFSFHINKVKLNASYWTYWISNHQLHSEQKHIQHSIISAIEIKLENSKRAKPAAMRSQKAKAGVDQWTEVRLRRREDAVSTNILKAKLDDQMRNWIAASRITASNRDVVPNIFVLFF
jgi:hypothetical protein